MTDRLSKSARTRQRILDAAAKVFREQGYSGARLVDIAELAGIQAGSLYYHFDSREVLVTEILHLGIQTASVHTRDAVALLPDDATPLERLATAIRAHTMAVLEISDYASAQARIVGQVPSEISHVHRQEQRVYGQFWHSLFVAAQEAGDIDPDVDLYTVRMLAFGAMNWTAEWFQPGRKPGAAAVAEQTVELVLHGVSPSRPARQRTARGTSITGASGSRRSR